MVGRRSEASYEHQLFVKIQQPWHFTRAVVFLPGVDAQLDRQLELDSDFESPSVGDLGLRNYEISFRTTSWRIR